MERKFYITTPIFYVNAPPHIGHAYTVSAADILARYHRLRKEKVFYLTGTDEHGLKIQKIAQEKGKNPKEFCDEISLAFKKAWKLLGISYDNFIRTTDPFHILSVQRALLFLRKKGFLYKGVYRGLYCVGCESFKRTDELVGKKCPLHQKEPIQIEEKGYFFKLSQFTSQIKRKIEKGELKIEPKERRREILAILKEGLKDILISREKNKVKWGIILPFDVKFTTYVWIDAFLNYLTGIGWEGDPQKLPEFWPPDLQIIGKDILRVHATIWPGLLMALKIPLPKRIFSHGFLTVRGEKMSKSLGNLIDVETMVEKFGVLATRYLLFSMVSFEEDGDISVEKFVECYNAELVNGLGNLVSRTAGVLRLCKGIKIEPSISDLRIRRFIKLRERNYHLAFNLVKLHRAIKEIKEVVKFSNNYIQSEKLWENPEKKAKAINNLILMIISIGESLEPFMPSISQKIKDSIGLKTEKRKIFYYKKTKREILFPRIEKI